MTKTELLADTELEDDILERQKPLRTPTAFGLCGAITGNGGTGPVGGWLAALCAPRLTERACIGGLVSLATLPKTAPSGVGAIKAPTE